MTSDLPQNIKNDFYEKNTLIIRDLIEELVRVVFGANNIPAINDKPLPTDDKLQSSDSDGSTHADGENAGTAKGFSKRIKTNPTYNS